MAETTGKSILKAAEEEVRIAGEEKLKRVLVKSISMISEREKWIAGRKSQISEIKKLQISMVRDFDSGCFDDSTQEAYLRRLSEIKSEAVSKMSVPAKGSRLIDLED